MKSNDAVNGLGGQARKLIIAGSKHAKKTVITASALGLSLMPSADVELHAGTIKNKSNGKAGIAEVITADQAGRTRFLNSNKITLEDTTLAPIVEAFAFELAEYGLLQTRLDKLNLAGKLQIVVDETKEADPDNPEFFVKSYLRLLKKLKDPKRDAIFDPPGTENGYTRKRLNEALMLSPFPIKSYGLLHDLLENKETVKNVTDLNEQWFNELESA